MSRKINLAGERRGPRGRPHAGQEILEDAAAPHRSRRIRPEGDRRHHRRSSPPGRKGHRATSAPTAAGTALSTTARRPPGGGGRWTRGPRGWPLCRVRHVRGRVPRARGRRRSRARPSTPPASRDASSSSRSPGLHAVLQDRTAEPMRIDRGASAAYAGGVYDEPTPRPGTADGLVCIGIDVTASAPTTVVLDHDANRVVLVREGHGKAAQALPSSSPRGSEGQHRAAGRRRAALDSGAAGVLYCPNAERADADPSTS